MHLWLSATGWESPAEQHRSPLFLLPITPSLPPISLSQNVFFFFIYSLLCSLLFACIFFCSFLFMSLHAIFSSSLYNLFLASLHRFSSIYIVLTPLHLSLFYLHFLPSSPSNPLLSFFYSLFLLRLHAVPLFLPPLHLFLLSTTFSTVLSIFSSSVHNLFLLPLHVFVCLCPLPVLPSTITSCLQAFRPLFPFFFYLVCLQPSPASYLSCPHPSTTFSSFHSIFSSTVSNLFLLPFHLFLFCLQPFLYNHILSSGPPFFPSHCPCPISSSPPFFRLPPKSFFLPTLFFYDLSWPLFPSPLPFISLLSSPLFISSPLPPISIPPVTSLSPLSFASPSSSPHFPSSLAPVITTLSKKIKERNEGVQGECCQGENMPVEECELSLKSQHANNSYSTQADLLAAISPSLPHFPFTHSYFPPLSSLSNHISLPYCCLSL